MTGYVCAVASGKGGVGKTTTAINIGAAFVSTAHDAVVVDADLAMANLAGTLGTDFEHSVHDVLAGEATVGDALTHLRDGLRIVPGARNLAALAEADPAKLRSVIEKLASTHDVVVVDTGSGLSHETTVPLGLADGIVLVVTPDEAAIRDAEKTAAFASRVDGKIVGSLLTGARRDADVELVRSRFDVPLLGVIPADEAAGDEPLVLTAPDSDAAEAYRQLTDTLGDVFFEDADPDDVQQAYDPAWVSESGASEETDDDGGYLSGFLSR